MVLRLVHHRLGSHILVSRPLLLAGDLPALILERSLVPETKGKELEDLDETFNISTKDFAAYHRDRAFYAVKRHVFRQNNLTLPSPPTPRPTELAAMSNSRGFGKMSDE